MAVVRFLLPLILLAVALGDVSIQLDDADCHGDTHTYEDNSGHLMTNNYPGAYSADCEWTVIISTLSRLPIILDFEGFSLGAGDSIQIYDNTSAYTETWVKGDSVPTDSLTLSSTIAVTFKSDSSEESTGVRLKWKDNSPLTLPALTTPSLPGEVVSRQVVPGSKSHIQPPGYPIRYQPNTLIHWLLTAPEGQRVVFDFIYFKTQSNADIVQFYSGYDRLTEELIGEYSGNLNFELPPPLISTTNWVHVKFRSDNFVNYKGFNLAYSIYDPPTAMGVTTESVKQPLDPAVIATIVILLLLVIVVVIAILVYCFWYKPKREMEITEQAALCANKNIEYTEENGVVMRLSTSRPYSGRPLTAGRPGTAARPGTAGRPGSTVRPRPGSVAQPRPGSAARPRPGSAARHRPETGLLRVPSDRPGTAKRNYDQNGKKVPLAALVGSRQTTIIRDPTIHPPAKKVQTPQILVNDGFEDDDVIYQKEGKLPRGTSRLPPLGAQLPPLTSSSLPPISNSNNSVPKLDLSYELPRHVGQVDKDEESDGW